METSPTPGPGFPRTSARTEETSAELFDPETVKAMMRYLETGVVSPTPAVVDDLPNAHDKQVGKAGLPDARAALSAAYDRSAEAKIARGRGRR